MTTYTTTKHNTVVRVESVIEKDRLIIRKYQFAFGTWVLFMRRAIPNHL